MSLTLRQMRQNCQKARDAMARAKSQQFAYGAFNLDDEPTLRAVAQAAAGMKAPIR